MAQIPDESTLSAAARRVFHRAEPGKGLIGPGPALAPPPFEGAPVWAAFPELMATGPRAASATFWWSAQGEPAEKEMRAAAASLEKGAAALAQGSQSQAARAFYELQWVLRGSLHEASSGRQVVLFDSNPSLNASHNVVELLACSIACAGR